MVEGRQPFAPAAFTSGEMPGTQFQRLSRPQGTWFRRQLREKSPVTDTTSEQIPRPSDQQRSALTTTLPQAPKEKCTSSISLRIKATGAHGGRPCHLQVPNALTSDNINLLMPSQPVLSLYKYCFTFFFPATCFNQILCPLSYIWVKLLYSQSMDIETNSRTSFPQNESLLNTKQRVSYNM